MVTLGNENIMNSVTVSIRANFSTYARYKRRYFQELQDVLGDVCSVEIQEIEAPKYPGVTLWEVFELWITAKIAEPMLEQLVRNLTDRLTTWFMHRLERGDEPVQGVNVKIYGPDGEVLSEVVRRKGES